MTQSYHSHNNSHNARELHSRYSRVLERHVEVTCGDSYHFGSCINTVGNEGVVNEEGLSLFAGDTCNKMLVMPKEDTHQIMHVLQMAGHTLLRSSRHAVVVNPENVVVVKDQFKDASGDISRQPNFGAYVR